MVAACVSSRAAGAYAAILVGSLGAPSLTHAQDLAAAEARLAARGCAACHSIDGSSRIGPSFLARAGTSGRVVSHDGASREVTFDRAYVRRSILEPDVELADGHAAGTMPRLAQDEADADALAADVMALAARAASPLAPARSIAYLLLATLAFVLGHFVLSASSVRRRLIARLSDNGFAGAYSVVVLGAFVWMVLEWSSAPYLELFRPPGWTRWIPNVVMPVSYTLLVAGYTTKSPTVAGMEGRAPLLPTGFVRITRHPALWGFALWALSHLATNGDVRSALLMGGIAILSLFGMLHIDARRRASGGEAWAAFERATSVVPFAAQLRGAAWPTFRELGWWRVVLGIVGWAGMLHLHRWLIGVSPLPF